MLFEDIGKILSDPERMGYLFSGLGNTVVITLFAAIIGLTLGIIVALVRIAAKQYKWMKIPSILCRVYTTVFRGTPVALQLFVFVFAIFAIRGFKPYAAILCFGINSGAYVSENIRAGIESVDKGQMEAGRALGLGWVKTMVKIIMPQAIKNIIPAIGNEMIALLKETAIISIVGATVGTITFDLTAAMDTVYYTGVPNYLACGLVAGAMYLLVVYFFVILIKLLERRLKKGDKR